MIIDLPEDTQPLLIQQRVVDGFFSEGLTVLPFHA